MKPDIDKAVEVLRQGGLILYPTDTVWGIGCDATNEAAVERIYRLKRSENKHGMLVLLDNADNVSRHFRKLPDIAWELLEVSDKPLTLILPGATGVAANLVPGDGTLGVRIPRHDFCRALISALKRPLVSTSANISGKHTPQSFSEVSREIAEGVDYVVPPKYEGHPTGQSSSIVKLGVNGEIEIIRK